MTAAIVEVDQATLTRLRTFANTHADEYGGLELYKAILDAGVALNYDDPTPSTPLNRWTSTPFATERRMMTRISTPT